jgi:hypothetical protein
MPEKQFLHIWGTAVNHNAMTGGNPLGFAEPDLGAGDVQAVLFRAHFGAGKVILESRNCPVRDESPHFYVGDPESEVIEPCCDGY